ncbi:sugar phosphate isomerase/epimerase family protein [Rugosimonospora africana]|uniref:Xylose isomerase n=1 Tax=Rugosimonospora africana TaxID=556532 RepID=A0A8J3QTK6_9ACTN|nr:sugar phosphate isomerase/epimerase family protein [Rugosimonospora africana]GIH16578.1 xylose isomerase [Rugosimonospora africana]
MATHPVTLFTAQWADLPFEEVARLASEWGFDGLEIACKPQHLDIDRALADDAYLDSRREILDRYGLGVWALSNHAQGQVICDDPLDFRHQAIVGPRTWGDGDTDGVRARATEQVKRTAILARKLGAGVVTGFTGSKIWRYVAMYPPVPEEVIDDGYADFAARWNPILDVFDGEGVRFALEVHPSEIAYDYWTTVRALEAVERRSAFGLNWDPSHMMWQDVNPANFIVDFADRIYHVDCKDTRLRAKDGRVGRLGSHLPWGDPRRGWDFVSAGHGDVPFEDAFRALESIGYTGPVSVEWEDAGMSRMHGAPQALAFVRSLLWESPEARFDAAFTQS